MNTRNIMPQIEAILIPLLHWKNNRGYSLLWTCYQEKSMFGKGSSGLAAMEMKFRFMRIGANIEAITDEHIMKMNSVLLDGDCAVIGISVSGKTEAVLESMKIAKKCGAKVILMTAHTGKKFLEFCDEIMLFALKENLEQGKAISPQLPILIMVDMLYSQMLQLDEYRRETLHEYTLEALDER